MSAASSRPIAVALHNGCGVMARDDLPAAAMQAALRAGWTLLAEGARAVDAVEALVVVL